MSVPLRKHLEEFGCDIEPDDFRDMLADMLAALYPGWTDERLTRNPDDAKRYCAAVRARTGLDLPDEFVLQTLTNIRKHRVTA